ncbi:hypothetical protein [Thermomonospora cellulosilytica]|uniref:Exonuclease VII large subunit n=1 Tax=Thermomonospora cellulosilytica TaxID=1411118 RepID=A0A7W3RB11_9ACTN|nr:hypothetical protein [Thermomonospora cellulosilytica]MBA9005850.1 exonuclease VII large subunit [Thermomonospora cellulosilytica]
MTPQPPAAEELRHQIEQALRNLPAGLIIRGAADAVLPILEQMRADLQADRDRVIQEVEAAIAAARADAEQLAASSRQARATGRHGEANRLDDVRVTIDRQADRFQHALDAAAGGDRS